MTEFHSEFHDAQDGPIHTGSGDLNVNPVYLSIYESVRRQARGPRLTLKDDLRWLKQRFVAPPNMGAARARLLETRTVLLTGPPGSGRNTAAKMLLDEITDENTPFSVLDDEATTHDERLTESKVHFGHRFVLDLTDSGEDVFRARHRELPVFRTSLQKQDAYLAIVVPDPYRHLIGADLRQLVVRIDRPRGDLVLRRHLEAVEIFPSYPELAADELAKHLAAPMSDIANLVDWVTRARDKAPDGDVPTWLGEAIAAHTDRSGEVTAQLKNHSTGRRRTVLLAAAMCRGASSDAVFFASHLLVKMSGLDQGEGPRLGQDGYRIQLDDLDIDVTPNNRIEFSRIAYDRALLEHFWDNYPDLRETFCRWVDRIIRQEQFTTADRQNVVDRFASQALRTSSPGHVEWLIGRWVSPTQRGPNLRDYGVRALVAGLKDVRHGRSFRQLVYRWSRHDDLPGEMGQIVVDVSTEVIAPNFPDQAVVRLQHRARREDGTGNPTARQALVSLTQQDPILLRLLLDRLATDLLRTAQWPADFLLFLDIADPWRLSDASTRSQPLAADQTVRSQLVTCWRAAMLARPDLILSRLHHWLAAAGQTASYDLLLRILAEAARPSIDLLAALHVTARDWSHTEHGRPEVAMRMSQLIDMAQGLQPADYVFPHASEEAVR
ncbi:ATP-binding protein [Saccharopolyspora sp. K220]|uniref:ATP-binding protein n=1 Tax=Saccharopolyspora soli TaxID=2926618 RepID=UPI001F57CC36|nr:ATP-binding protein [Saccharopolyspora soli]MCI2418345.1 ATP-binding protein [Saccharopolyspora soli]